MKRRLFILAAAVSLLLCVATIAIWVRSYFLLEGWNWQRETPGIAVDGMYHLRTIRSMDGRIWFAREDTGYPSVINLTRKGYVRGDPHQGLFYLGNLKLRGGFEYALLGQSALVIAIPYWLPALVTAVPVIAWVARAVRRRRRLASDQCVTCGYDLRATPERCPECGTEAKAITR